jgi:uncharacterized protein
MNGLIGIGAVLGLLIGAGLLLGQLNRAQFSARWLFIAAALVLINDAALTNLYGLLPNIFGGDRNWQGKILALAATLAIASTSTFGFKNSGFTLAQNAGSLRSSIPVAAFCLLFFLALALAFPSEPSTAENMAFQLTMPGFEEEAFYRGTLLFALNEAFRARARFLGVDWGWGALLSCALFGLTHAFGYSDGGFNFDPIIMAMTAIPAFLGVWMREKTGSILMPMLLHNFGNSISMIV